MHRCLGNWENSKFGIKVGDTNMAHIKFDYKGTGDLAAEINRKGYEIPLESDMKYFGLELGLKKFSIKNRFLSQPMETCDANPADGTPSILTYTKYERISKGGAAIIWVEAIAVTEDCRSNPYQLCMTDKNIDEFKKLVFYIKRTGELQNGFVPLVIAQLNHSGRYTKEEGKPAPKIMYNNPEYEKTNPIDKSRIITDGELKKFEQDMGNAARLAQEAGFDGVDIKACHKYLISESLSAYERPGAYGGSFENRTRLFRNCIESAMAATKNYYFTARMNIYDGCRYPYGFGMDKDGSLEHDMEEPLKLGEILRDKYGFDMLNLVCGNPYVNPDISRPYSSGDYIGEDPLNVIDRNLRLTRYINKNIGSRVHIVISSLGYLRQYIPIVGAGLLRNDFGELIGLGRPMLAYPDMPNDVLKKGKVQKNKSCLTCSKCAVLKNDMVHVGCVARNSTNFNLKGYKGK